MTRATRRQECMRCGTVATTVMLPTGPICHRCRIRIAYHPAVCPECFELRPIAYPSIRDCGVLVCAGCAETESVFACAQCGREDNPYGASRCARCILTDRLTDLLTDPDTGAVRTELTPLFHELATARRPQSVITWMQKPPATGVRLLGMMARGELPISHDTFRELPADRSHNYLRELLTSTGVLPAFNPSIEQMERWLDTTLARVAGDDLNVIERYARWHILRGLRRTAARGTLGKAATYGARAKINAAVRLSAWTACHGLTLAILTQPQLEVYLTEHPGARTSLQGFVAWLHRSRSNRAVTIPWRAATMPEVIDTDDDRWKQVARLLHDESIALYARIGGLFTLLFAQPLESVVAMRTSQITTDANGRIAVTFDTAPVEMPPGLEELIHRHLAQPGTGSIARADHGWLFPGRHPGRHRVRESFRAQLVAVDIWPGRSRRAAMFALAGQVPAPVLAELIGVADKTAVKWAALAARDWSNYIAQRQL